MKITVIGGGYVGSAIARKWHEVGHEVTVTTTTPEKVAGLSAVANRVAIAYGTDLASIEAVVAGREVVLLSVGAKQRTPDNYRQSYLETAENVIRAIKTTASVGQLIYTSSYGVLGDRNGAEVDETVPVTPANEYGEILSQTEQTLLSVPKSDFKVCILRLAGIYGAGRELIKIFRRLSGTTRAGAGDDYSNWIHLDDIMGAIDFARAKQLAGIYHVAGDESPNTKELFDRLFATHNLPSVTWDLTQPSTRPYNTRISSKKLQAAGFKLVHPQIIF